MLHYSNLLEKLHQVVTSNSQFQEYNVGGVYLLVLYPILLQSKITIFKRKFEDIKGIFRDRKLKKTNNAMTK